MTQPVNELPTAAVQKALVTRLRADTTLAGLLAAIKAVTPSTPAVMDDVPEGQSYPYVVVGEHLSIPGNDLTSYGRQITETLHVWTKTRSMTPGQAIASRIVRLLDHQDRALTALLTADGHRCVRISHEFDQALRDPDPQIRHHILRFRIETEQLT